MLIRRETSNGADDLITVYRPCTVDEIIGQEVNKKLLSNNLKKNNVSHSLLFTGPPGTGKTTAARIIALGLNCLKSKNKSTTEPCLKCETCKSTLNHHNVDVAEINVGKAGGKDAVDKITRDLPFGAVMARNKIIIFDEAHKLTPAAQDLLFKEIEDGYSHVYFIFCTNKPEKLQEALLDRLDPMHFGSIADSSILELLNNICEFEGVPSNPKVLRYITEIAKGIPRKAIQRLKKVIAEDSWDLETIKILLSNEFIDEDNLTVIDVYKELLKGSFKVALNKLVKLKNVPEEGIRIAMAGCFTQRLKTCSRVSEGDKFSAALDILTVPIFLTGKPAHHVLVNSFYKVSRIMKG